MKIRICDICKKEKSIYFKCKIKRHTLSIDEYGFAWDDPMWFKAEICEDCLKKIIEEAKDGNCR